MDWKKKQKKLIMEKMAKGVGGFFGPAPKVLKVINPKPPKPIKAPKPIKLFFDPFEDNYYRAQGADAYKFSTRLQKRGFKMLGSGAYSMVFAKGNSDRVIKVTRRPDGWIDYIQWAAKNGYCGRFAPRVYSYKKIKDFEVAVVERLDKTMYNVEHKTDEYLITNLADHYFSGNIMAGLFIDELAPGIATFLSQLKTQFCEGGKSRLDSHRGNWMVRKDGSVCFTDPICGEKAESTTKRLKAKDFVSLATAKGYFYGKRYFSRFRYD